MESREVESNQGHTAQTSPAGRIRTQVIFSYSLHSGSDMGLRPQPQVFVLSKGGVQLDFSPRLGDKPLPHRMGWVSSYSKITVVHVGGGGGSDNSQKYTILPTYFSKKPKCLDREDK